MNEILSADPSSDNHVVGEIVGYLSKTPPQSFFLYAGAGAGKTRTLISVLDALRETRGRQMRLKNQQIAVITYTNAACDEILHRLKHDALFDVRTIHSFVWTLIQGFNADMREWLRKQLQKDIEGLLQEQAKGRPGTKASIERERSIHSKNKRLGLLDQIRVFNYSPESDNRERDSLSHSEVISLAATFLREKPLMRRFLVSRYPILLVDESQDTNKSLIDSLIEVQSDRTCRLAIGLIGDTMQRIYSEGRADLADIIPKDWATPRMRMNHRSPARVVQLINKIRADVDSEQQKYRNDASQGTVRLFLCTADSANHEAVESQVRAKMSEVTGDQLWSNSSSVKTLLLEHHMAARRMGFTELFEPLYRNEAFKTGLLNGELPLLKFFTELVLPLVNAGIQNDKFKVAAILRKHSELLSVSALQAAGSEQRQCLDKAQMAVNQLLGLWSAGLVPTLAMVLECIHSSQLLPIPESLLPFTTPVDAEEDDKEQGDDTEIGDATARLAAIREFLKAPFSQLRSYRDYVEELASFDTHQGVKGRQFDRVMVVINDTESRGFMFKYGALFGSPTAKSTRQKGQAVAKESPEDRPRRLFYVTCSRSMRSLAVVAYSDDPETVKTHVINKQWFEYAEIETLS